MNTLDTLFEELEKCNYKISTDTRKGLSGSIYFALRGETFDGNTFVREAMEKGARAVVTDTLEYKTLEHVYFVDDVLRTLQEVAKKYRESFTIPIICIGGSNGKTTSKELVRDVLKTTYRVHATEGSLNNHIGVPLSILAMDRNTEIGVFEIGANHPGEHITLLNILEPTHLVVTNNGMDHLDGFGSPEGVRLANKELYDWALAHEKEVFVDKTQSDLMEDSKNNKRILYPTKELESTSDTPLSITHDGKTYTTHFAGNYNLANIQLSIAISYYFKVSTDAALNAISAYKPSSKRSEFLAKNNVNYIVDCYNANPTSMMLSLHSFVGSAPRPRGVVLGDMLELGKYSEAEHGKIVEYVFRQNFECILFIGEEFNKVLENTDKKYYWFPNSDQAKIWFAHQQFTGFTFLLKGSRGIKVEKILEV